MAGQLPILSGRNVRKAFEKDGWQLARQRGSHMVMVKEGSMANPLRARPQGSRARHPQKSHSRLGSHR
jgi:hypothetical protein